MSATQRGAQRIEMDNYPTPPWCIDVILAEIKSEAFEASVTWLEPCRGDGRIFNSIPQDRRTWCEIQEGRDYLKQPAPADVCLTNPPFSVSLPFAKKALRECGTVIFLQRLNWLGSAQRQPFWQASPPTHLFVLSRRPAFVHVCATKACRSTYLPEAQIKTCPTCGGKVKPGTDATEYAWFCWDRLHLLKRPPGVYVV